MGHYSSFPNLYGRVVAADGETTGLDWHRDELFGIGIAYRETDAQSPVVSHYFDIRYPEARSWAEMAFTDIKLWVNHYIKFDAHMFRQAGIRYPRKRISCTMIREAIIDENKYEYGLNLLSHKYLKRGKVEIWDELAAMFGGAPIKEVQIKNLPNAPEAMVSKYAKVDAELALLVHECQDVIIQQEQLERVRDLEQRLLAIIIDLEFRGVRVDLDRAHQAHRKLNKLVWENQRALNQRVGYNMNANSPDQVKKVLGVHLRQDGHWYTGDGLRLESNPPTKAAFKKALETGTKAIGTASLDSIKMQQCTLPEAQLIVDIRGQIKARDTMIEQYMLNMNHEGYVHASFNQTRTEDGNGIYTGRISISDPALQQIHKRNKVMAAIVRACFVPDDGEEWGCYDWRQMDFRLFAHFLNDLRINAMYAKDPLTDFHTFAAELTGLPRDRDQKTGGANAKQINLACVFGMGAGQLAKQCNLPYVVSDRGYLVAGPEAKAMFGKYHRAIPGVRNLQSSVEGVAKSRGHIVTQLGRRLRFPNGYGSHKAAGLLYQATAADAMKLKMCEAYDLLESLPNYCGRLLMTVHDEFDNSFTPEFFERGYEKDYQAILERFDGVVTPMKFRIPIRADFGRGGDWWEASK